MSGSWVGEQHPTDVLFERRQRCRGDAGVGDHGVGVVQGRDAARPVMFHLVWSASTTSRWSPSTNARLVSASRGSAS